MGNKYGTPSPVPFRVVDQRAGIDIDIAIRCFGEYSYRITNPILFYTNVCGNVEEGYTRDEIDGQLKSELMTALQPAFAKISDMGIRYSALPGHTMELAEALNEVLRCQVGQAARHRDRILRRFQREGQRGRRADAQGNAAQRSLYGPDPRRCASCRRTGQRHADRGRQSGRRPRHGLYGHEYGRCGGRHERPEPVPDGRPAAGRRTARPGPGSSAPAGWTCSCGQTGNTGKFCANCGSPKPAPAPAADSWVCSCGTSNTGKFCCNCGNPKPAPAPAKCSQCGWTPDDPAHPPKFCPECGKPFGQ